VSTIHNHSKKYVTLGSACLKWNSDVSPAVGNKWSDKSLRDASGKSNAQLDFYQIHYYDWMYPYYDPYSKERAYWRLDKVTLIGETGNTGHYSYS
jgi:hypothetical protein